MLKLIPAVKKLEMLEGFLNADGVCYDASDLDGRVRKALEKLPFAKDGAKLSVQIGSGDGEGYSLQICADSIRIEADSPAGAFYGVQTLRQIFKHPRVPCLRIEDQPDFPHRGFYQTRSAAD